MRKVCKRGFPGKGLREVREKGTCGREAEGGSREGDLRKGGGGRLEPESVHQRVRGNVPCEDGLLIVGFSCFLQKCHRVSQVVNPGKATWVLLPLPAVRTGLPRACGKSALRFAQKSRQI